MRLSNEKYAFITGAASGIGLSYAKAFAVKGFNLLITGRRKEILEDNTNTVRTQHHIIVKTFIVEFSNDEIEQLLTQINDYNVEILINNAGLWSL